MVFQHQRLLVQRLLVLLLQQGRGSTTMACAVMMTLMTLTSIYQTKQYYLGVVIRSFLVCLSFSWLPFNVYLPLFLPFFSKTPYSAKKEEQICKLLM
jgi:hypothetical protein